MRAKPNVLLVIGDEWRGQALGCHGDVNAHTPAIDRFAAESIDFYQAISGTPVCSPARASLMTGQYCLSHGVYINDVELKPKAPTLAEVFAASGYRTGYIGKWHLYGSPEGRFERRQSFIPRDHRFGFDYWKVGECSHNYLHSLYYAGDDPTPRYWDEFDAFAQTADAETFIRDHANASDPYFLVVSYGPPHFPYLTPSPYHERWESRELSLRPNVRVSEHTQVSLRGYYASIEALDDCFARLLSAVAASGADDDTLVVFMSDHGELAYSQGFDCTKILPWEESISIPFLARYPRRFGRPGMRSDAPLNMPDVMPTLLGWSGLSIPEGVEGVDWSARNSTVHDVDSAFLCVPASFATMRSDGFAEYRGVRTSRYTYVRSVAGPWLLYDRARDPYQMKNLIGHADLRDVEQSMQRELERWLANTKDEFLRGVEYLRRDDLSHYLEVQNPTGSSESPWGDWRSTIRPEG